MSEFDRSLFWATPESELPYLDPHEPEDAHHHYVQAVEHLARAQHIDAADARKWAQAWRCQSTPEQAVAQLLQFDDAGFSVTEAIEWHRHEIYCSEAVAFRRHGWTPTQAIPLTLAAPLTYDEWVDTGLPADTVLLAIKAGLHPGEAIELVAENSGHHVVMTTLAALRGGDDSELGWVS